MKTAKQLREQAALKIEEAERLLEQLDSDAVELSDEQRGKLVDDVEKLNDEAESLNRQARVRESIEQKSATKAAKAVAADHSASDSETKEAEKFSYMKAVRDVLETGSTQGLEREMFDEANKDFKGVNPEGQIRIPERFSRIGRKPQKRDVTIGTEGGDIMQTTHGALIDRLYINPAVVQAGARVLTGLTGDFQHPRNSAGATFDWEGENDANAETTPTYDNITLTPHRVGGYIDVSKQAIMQASFGLEQSIAADVSRGFQIKIDEAAINGSGSGAVPEGVLQTSGIGAHAMGTNGAALDWAAVTALEKEVGVDSALMGSLAYITNAKVVNAAKVTDKFGTGAGVPILPAEVGRELNGYNLIVSENVPDNLTKGTGTGLSALLFGNFDDLLIGQFGGMDFVVDTYTQATNVLVRMVFNMWVDIKLRHPESFAACQDISAS